MSVLDDMESVEREVRELILHSKSKRCTIFEPCNEENLPKYLKSIEDELSVLGISYRFNQYSDLDEERRLKTLVRLANGTWGLLLHHKEVAENGAKLKDRNYSLQQNNFFLNETVDKQKKQLEAAEACSKQAAENSRQMVLKLEAGHAEARSARADAKRSRSQLATREHELLTQLRKAERDHAGLKERFIGANGIYISKNEARSNAMEEFRLKEKKYKETIAKLQENNRQLIQEVINLKEDLMEDAREEEDA